MTTIILTTLGILIAAASALMVVYYGGDMYRSGTVGAEANRVMNAGANVVAAIDQFRINERRDPADVSALVDGGYFKPDGVPGDMALTRGSPGRFTISGVADNVCARINETMGRSAADASAGLGTSGCHDGVYYTIT